MSNFEKKFGKYAINNLTIIMILIVAAGYVLELAPQTANILMKLTLNPGRILQGEVWRLFTWVLNPPTVSSEMFIVFLLMYFYYSIGTHLERVWGAFRYNVYIFSGLLLTVVAAFLAYGFILISVGGNAFIATEIFEYVSIYSFTVYYVCTSVLLAYAVTFPEGAVLFMFVIPLKMSWLGKGYGAWLIYKCIKAIASKNSYDVFEVFVIVASLINFGVFWVRSGKLMHLKPKEIKRRQEFKRSAKMTPPGITKHKCAFCGRTEDDDPNLEFRFCSKCNGNYEYCSDHLFTHVHVK